jgi:hypothetical protein
MPFGWQRLGTTTRILHHQVLPRLEASSPTEAFEVGQVLP